MLKSIHKQKRRASLAVHRATKKATAAGLLIALTAGVSFAQSLPAAQANRTAQSESQADVATLLTLQRAIALALDGNPDLKVSPVEESKARVAEAGVRVELAQAQSEHRNARGRLASLLGANPPRFTLVAGNVEALPPVPSTPRG